MADNYGFVGGAGGGYIGGGGGGYIGGGGGGYIGGSDGSGGYFGGEIQSAIILSEISARFRDLFILFQKLAGMPISGCIIWHEFKPQVRFFQQDQLESEWCWIAVAVSVRNYFERQRTMQQCELAGKLLTKNCCGHRTDCACHECNKPGPLLDALSEVKHLKGGEIEESAGQAGGGQKSLTFDQIKAEIDNGLPVCAFIQWDTENIGHFCVISGYKFSESDPRNEKLQCLFVHDPIFGSGSQPFEQFKSNYNLQRGTWKAMYKLKA
jgi:hypothetical protein